jgi:hypothetical protein
MPPNPTMIRGVEYMIKSIKSFLSKENLKFMSSFVSSKRVIPLAINPAKKTYPMPILGL